MGTPAPARRRRARLRTVVVAAVVAACFGVALVSQWREVTQTGWRFAPAMLALATGLLGLSYALVAWLWGMALADRAGVPARRGARIWFLSNLARYVPGNIWSYVGAVELARREGATRQTALAVMALTQLLSVAVAVVVGLPVLVAQRASLGRAVLVGGLVVAAGVVIAAVARRPIERLVAARYPSLTLRDLVPPPLLAVKLTIGYLVYWGITGLAFAAFVRSLYPIAAGDVLTLVAAFTAAYAAGFLSLLSPAGLGVREVVLVIALSGVMATGPATAVALTSRLWMMLVELAGAGVAHLLAGKGGQPPPAPHGGEERPDQRHNGQAQGASAVSASG
jgi:glycosyltransferase 2 family protein